LYQMDFREMLQHHIESQAEVTIGTIPVTAKDASDFGILKTDEKGTITSFTEKPKQDVLAPWASPVSDEMHAAGREYLASMGIYIFSRSTLNELLKGQEAATDFGKEIIPYAINADLKVMSYQYTGYWTDIGNISSFWEANLSLTDEIPQFNLFDEGKIIYSRARMLPPAKMSGTFNKTIISDGTIISDSTLERCVVGIRARIGRGSVITNSYIMGSDFYQTLEDLARAKAKGHPPMGIGDNCVINNAIIDKNVSIGNNVKINVGETLPDGEHEQYTVKDGIVVIKNGMVLPDGFVI
ncbi:MAG: glucose-1-phosphate adenylyltransferase, partial [Bacteroidetes bacterium]|nr:glucose-1-phosphate adenylyltransferase [Bacteroidota bacterium]